jgi:hypothetical protein
LLVRPTLERPLSPCVISTVSQRTAADRGAVGPFRGEAQIASNVTGV